MMDLEALQQAWQKQEEKLERNWQLNLALLRNTNLDKAQSKMRKYIWVTGLTVAFYMASTISLIIYATYSYPSVGKVSAAIVLGIWTAGVTIAAIRQLELVNQLDYAAPITTVQKQLEHLKTTIIKYFRWHVWIVPCFLAYIVLFFDLIWGIDVIAIGDRYWLISNIILGFVFIIPAVWAFRKLDPKNADKKWMRKLLAGNGSQVYDAMVFVKEIEAFEKPED